jgi:hypothetical protein
MATSKLDNGDTSQIKRDNAQNTDENPVLFSAYLALLNAHMEWDHFPAWSGFHITFEGGKLLPVTGTSASGEYTEESVYDNILNGAFIPSVDEVLASDYLLIPFETALLNYVEADTTTFLSELANVSKQSEPVNDQDFLNLPLEDLFNIPVSEGASNAQGVSQSDQSGSVSSAGEALGVNNSLENALQIQQNVVESIVQELSLVTALPTEETILEPFITSPTAPIPTTPDVFINKSLVSTVTPSLVPVLDSEFYLNTYHAVLIEGNVLNTGFGFSFSSSAGASASIKSISASFASIQPGDTQTQPIPGEILLTTAQGNTLAFYTQNVGGFQEGDFVFTLNHAILPSSSPFTIITEDFLYSITNNFNNTSVGMINIDIVDDQPVANNQTNPTPILEAEISHTGSLALHSATLDQLAGGLLTPLTPSGNLIVSPTVPVTPVLPPADANYFGANGGSVTSVTVVGDTNAFVGVTQASQTTTTITAQDITKFHAAGLSGSALGDPAILVTDSL